MELKFSVDGQKVSFACEEMPVADSLSFLSASFSFTEEWEGMVKTAVFDHRDLAFPYFVLMDGDRIPRESFPGLFPGEWAVGVLGVKASEVHEDALAEGTTYSAEEYIKTVFGDAVDTRITTRNAKVEVIPSAVDSGTIPVPEDTSVYDSILAAFQNTKAIADDVKEKADSGEFNGFSPTVTVETMTRGNILRFLKIGRPFRVIRWCDDADSDVSRVISFKARAKCHSPYFDHSWRIEVRKNDGSAVTLCAIGSTADGEMMAVYDGLGNRVLENLPRSWHNFIINFEHNNGSVHITVDGFGISFTLPALAGMSPHGIQIEADYGGNNDELELDDFQISDAYRALRVEDTFEEGVVGTFPDGWYKNDSVATHIRQIEHDEEAEYRLVIKDVNGTVRTENLKGKDARIEPQSVDTEHIAWGAVTTERLSSSVQSWLTRLADKTSVYTKEEVDGLLSSVYHFCGNKATWDDLPTEGMKVGDTYNIEDTGENVAWTETGWDSLSGFIDLTPFMTKEEAEEKFVSDPDYVHTDNNFTTVEKEKLEVASALASSNSSAISTHIYNGDIHITAAEREAWNGYSTEIEDVKTSYENMLPIVQADHEAIRVLEDNVNTHIGNEDIHITAEEKETISYHSALLSSLDAQIQFNASEIQRIDAALGTLNEELETALSGGDA